MRNLAVRLKAEGKPIVNFAAGELHDETSKLVKTAAMEAIQFGNNKYTETHGTRELRSAIAKSIERQTGLQWTEHEIAVTAGAKQALYNTAMTLFDPGDEVIVPKPYWTTFPVQITLAGGKPIFVDCTSTNFTLSVDMIARSITASTKAIILNTPNNPTGNVISPDILVGISKIALLHNLWVVFDQCYSDFVYDGKRHTNILRVAPDLRSRVVIVDSFSKSHAMAGWRIGYAAAPKDFIDAMGNLQSHTTSNANSIAQCAALAALQSRDMDYHQSIYERLVINRRIGIEILTSIPFVTVAPPDGGFYFYLDVRKIISHKGTQFCIRNASTLAEHLLSKAYVAVVPGDAFGDPNGIRISYAIDKCELVNGLNRLAENLVALYRS